MSFSYILSEEKIQRSMQFVSIGHETSSRNIFKRNMVFFKTLVFRNLQLIQLDSWLRFNEILVTSQSVLPGEFSGDFLSFLQIFL